MKQVLSVLDITAEEVKDVISRELGAIYDIRFAGSYDRQEQLALAAAADFIWVGAPAVDAEMIARAPRLKVIHKCGIGVDKIDLEAARARGVKVYITGGANAIPVAEMALMMMMAVSRRFVYGDASLRKGKWLTAEIRGVSQHLTGKTIGIVGMGNIGKTLARLLKGFDCRLQYYDLYRLPPEMESGLGITYTPLEELLGTSDAVTLHVPLTPETKNLINARTLALMKKGAILVNTARGDLVDEAALIDALRKGTIAGAGLDVFEAEPLPPDHPFLSMDNVVLSPHLAGSTLNNLPIRTKHIRKNLEAFLSGGEISRADAIVA